MVKKSENGSTTVPPFLAKCYDMLDDQSTDKVISWSDSGESFIIWDVTQFSRDLLPKFFKHNNFSSFMRQLNIYGFRKLGFDNWEFHNEHFTRGQKHLMVNIKRRKHPQSQSSSQQKMSSQAQEDHPVEKLEEEYRSRLEKEVETLESDKKALMQELLKLREHQESSQNTLLLLRERLQGMEKSQQQLLSFLVMVFQNPGFLLQLLQSKEANWRVAESGKITIGEGVDDSNAVAVTHENDGMIVRYQPLENEDVNPVIAPWSDSRKGIEHDIQSFDHGKNNEFPTNFDFSSFSFDENLLFCSEQPRGPIILPELDLRALEQFLLGSPVCENAENNMLDAEEEEIFDSEIELESMCCGKQQEESQPGRNNDLPENMEFLTQQMELLSPRRNVI